MKLTRPFTFAAVLALTMATTHAGGWAIITLEDVPQRFVVSKPTTLTYSVRQHGTRLVGGLNGGVSARSGTREVSALGIATDRPGYYSASLTLPDAGGWTLTIHSGFGPDSKLTLRPIRAIASESALPPSSAVERGEELFVAKGCGSCHRHDAAKADTVVSYFADLTARRYPTEFLAQLLKEPSMMRSANGQWQMPNLGLRDQEIAALIAFINKPSSQ